MELKNCDCCNGDNLTIKGYTEEIHGEYYYVKCKTCNLRGRMADTEELAKKLWNKWGTK